MCIRDSDATAALNSESEWTSWSRRMARMASLLVRVTVHWSVHLGQTRCLPRRAYGIRPNALRISGGRDARTDSVHLVAAHLGIEYALRLILEGVHHVRLSLIHISEPTRLGMISYAVFCLKK